MTEYIQQPGIFGAPPPLIDLWKRQSVRLPAFGKTLEQHEHHLLPSMSLMGRRRLEEEEVQVGVVLVVVVVVTDSTKT